MKKVLILAYDFPPYVTVGGLRPYSWYKHFKDYDIEPVVITRQWKNKYGYLKDYNLPSASKEVIIDKDENGVIIRTPYKPTLANKLFLKYGDEKYRAVRGVFTGIDEIKQFICVFGAKKNIFKEAKHYLKKNEVDLIIATGEPFVLFYYAKILGKKYNIPWIADYRDPWSQSRLRQVNFLYNNWMKFIEKRIVKFAKLIITPNKQFKQTLHQLFPDKRIEIIRNGFDGTITSKYQREQNTKVLTIAFVGTTYNYHPWKSFLTTVDEVLNNISDSIKIKFYGVNNQDEIEDHLSTLSEKISNSVEFIPRLENKELIKQISQDNIMLLFNYYSNIGTKIFDYLAIRRKIILCYSEDAEALVLKEKYFPVVVKNEEHNDYQAQCDMIKNTKSGIIVKDAIHLKIVLLEQLQEFKEKGKIECNSVGIEKYSRRKQVERLAIIIHDLLAS